MRTRREVLQISATALTGALLPASGIAQTATPLRILFLGGTGFVGPHLVHPALARGHRVAMLNRGRRTPNQHADDFAKVEALRGETPRLRRSGRSRAT